MMLFMQPQFTASSAAISLVSSHLHANTANANRGSKRTTWYRALADQATWSPIG